MPSVCRQHGAQRQDAGGQRTAERGGGPAAAGISRSATVAVARSAVPAPEFSAPQALLRRGPRPRIAHGGRPQTIAGAVPSAASGPLQPQAAQRDHADLRAADRQRRAAPILRFDHDHAGLIGDREGVGGSGRTPTRASTAPPGSAGRGVSRTRLRRAPEVGLGQFRPGGSSAAWRSAALEQDRPLRSRARTVRGQAAAPRHGRPPRRRGRKRRSSDPAGSRPRRASRPSGPGAPGQGSGCSQRAARSAGPGRGKMPTPARANRLPVVGDGRPCCHEGPGHVGRQRVLNGGADRGGDG